MRRGLVLLAGAALLAVIPAAPAGSQGSARPDLVVSSAAEPPDFELADGRFRHSFTVANNGRRAARRTNFGAFLSPDPVVGGNDIRLRGSSVTQSRVLGVGRNRQRTRRITLNIPATVPSGFYHLIGCADASNVVRESNERNNCHVSGQLVGIDANERGRNGTPGRRGADGANGRDLDRRRFGRSTLSIGAPTEEPASNSDEGSTSMSDLMTVGPVTLKALCRNTPPDNNEDEAKLLVYTDTGNMSFRGRNGPRSNVPAGVGVADNDGPNGGEGKHQIVAVERPQSQPFGFHNVNAWISHSNGTELYVQGYAGIDVLGVGDNCVFGGVVTVIKLA